MKAAQREAIADLVRASGSVPLDVGGLQVEQIVTETDIVVAHGAAAFVRPQHGVAEGRVAPWGLGVSYDPLSA